jgi:DNA-directed RNA polymerase specialized sigma24 family protein
VLYAWAELSYEEIAHATHVAVGTVRSRLARARARLTDELAAERSTS